MQQNKIKVVYTVIFISNNMTTISESNILITKLKVTNHPNLFEKDMITKTH